MKWISLFGCECHRAISGLEEECRRISKMYLDEKDKVYKLQHIMERMTRELEIYRPRKD